jgi:SAM-dependent methyltransferase
MKPPMPLVASTAKQMAKACLRPFGRRLTRPDPPHRKTHGYIDARATVAAARAARQTICEYVETLWDQRGATLRVVNEMETAGLGPCERVLEIGPGTGRYLELVCKLVNPKQYDIYEIADDWAEWLVETYSPPVIRQPADGHTLRSTPTASCDLVHAHGVFVYLNLTNAYEYFVEMLRVCVPGGLLAFDCFPAETFNEDMIIYWLEHGHRYPVALMEEHLRSLFKKGGCKMVREFDNKYGCGKSHYLVFQKGLVGTWESLPPA